MIHRTIALIMWSALLAWLLAFTLPAIAQDRLIRVEVESSFDPKSAIGIVIQDGSSLQRAPQEIERVGAGKYAVSFTVPSANVSSESLATAMLISDSGQIVFGPVTPAIPTVPLLKKLELCPAEKIDLRKMQAQLGEIQPLVQLRAEQRELFKRMVGEKLQGAFLTQLQDLERGFGLENGVPLTADLPPYTLVKRLGALKIAIDNVSAQSKFRDGAGE